MGYTIILEDARRWTCIEIGDQGEVAVTLDGVYDTDDLLHIVERLHIERIRIAEDKRLTKRPEGNLE